MKVVFNTAYKSSERSCEEDTTCEAGLLDDHNSCVPASCSSDEQPDEVNHIFESNDDESYLPESSSSDSETST